VERHPESGNFLHVVIWTCSRRGLQRRSVHSGGSSCESPTSAPRGHTASPPLCFHQRAVNVYNCSLILYSCEQRGIQFSLFCIAQYHKLQICLRGLYNLDTYHIPVPGPHIRTNSQEIEKKPFTGKKGKKPSGEQQRRIPLQDGQNNRCHVTRNHYTVTTLGMKGCNAAAQTFVFSYSPCVGHMLHLLKPKHIDDFPHACVRWCHNQREARIRTCSGMRPAIDFQCGSSAAVAGRDMNRPPKEVQRLYFLSNAGSELTCSRFKVFLLMLYFPSALFQLMSPCLSLQREQRSWSVHIESFSSVRGADATADERAAPFVSFQGQSMIVMVSPRLNRAAAGPEHCEIRNGDSI